MNHEEEIQEQIYNLVKNSLKDGNSKQFINDAVELATPEAIIKLAMQELKAIKYFILIENDDFDYWKQKKSRLLNVILLQNELMK